MTSGAPATSTATRGDAGSTLTGNIAVPQSGLPISAPVAVGSVIVRRLEATVIGCFVTRFHTLAVRHRNSRYEPSACSTAKCRRSLVSPWTEYGSGATFVGPWVPTIAI